MRRLSGSRRNQYLARVSILLILAALIAAMAGCPGVGYNPPPSQNLEIRTWYDLDAVRNNTAGHHTLMNNLDSTTPGYEELAGPTANGGKGWEPITRFVPHYGFTGFGGTFDGQGHEIRDLFINRPDESGVALFFATSQNGVIKDLGVTNVTVTGADYVGALVGSSTGSIINSYSSGNVTGEYRVGNLAGGSGGTVFNSYSSGNVTGNSSVGGLVGVNMGSVNSSHSTGSLIGVDDVGGLVGYSYYGTVSNSYSTGNVTGYSNVGGLVGLNGWEVEMGGGSAVGDSYSTGRVTGYENVGGLVGYNYYSTVSDCYSSGTVTGSSSVGGLLGYKLGDGVVSDSFWDTETSGQATSAGGVGKNTTEMQDIATFSGAAWTITAVANSSTREPAYIWNIVNNMTYPFLSWQPV
jgi:hypothetical protein